MTAIFWRVCKDTYRETLIPNIVFDVLSRSRFSFLVSENPIARNEEEEVRKIV